MRKCLALRNVHHTLVRVFPNGHVQTIAGAANSTALIGPVFAVFGRTDGDHDILYIGTDGLTINPATGKPLTTNGKITMLDTRSFH